MIYVQKVKRNLAEQYRKNLPIGWVFVFSFIENILKTTISKVAKLM